MVSEATMMIRKAIKQGPATLMVSLPPEWLRKNNIHRGDNLYLTDNNTALILQAQPQVENKEITIIINTREDYCPRLLTMPYLQGYNEITINFKDSAIQNEIEHEIKYLPGFEIIKSTNNTCTIKNISQGIEAEFENILNRLTNVLIFMGNETYSYVKKGDYVNIMLLKSCEIESNKLSLLSRRMLNTKGIRTEKNTYAIYSMVTLMEAVGDEFRFIIEYLAEKKPALHAKTLAFFEDINKMLKTFNQLYTKFDTPTFVKFRAERQEIEKKRFKQFEKLPKEDMYVAHKLYNIMELIHHATYF